MRLLVFDDDAAIGRLVIRIATASGIEATAVTDAAAFEKQLRSDPPDIVALDLQLGGTDGVEQMRVLAGLQFKGALLLMSGYDARVLATARSVGQSLGLKIELMLEKPLVVQDLERALQRLQSVGQSITTGRLLEAIANDELILDFQPLVSRKPKTLKKLEALVRWEHPVFGVIPPAEFLPVAESDAATMDSLTDWVLSAAVEAYQVLTELGVSVPLAVNLSTQNLHDLELPDRIEQCLQAGGMPARHLCLEITESAAFKDAARTMDILSRMRLKGMQISLDDFGTGYSSLKVLRQMPFSEVKIDRSFICDITTSRDSRAIVKSIIDLAANMEMGCVAEGVETEETAELLEQLGICDMQGYLIARPMPIESVPAWQAIWTQSSPATRRDQATIPVSDQTGTSDRGIGNSAPSAISSAKPGGGDVRLRPRQIDVMRLLADGYSVKQIAHRLGLGIGTVKVHLALAYTALGVHNRTDAIRRAGPALLDNPEA